MHFFEKDDRENHDLYSIAIYVSIELTSISLLTNATNGSTKAFPVPNLLRGLERSPSRPLLAVAPRFQDRSTSEHLVSSP